MLKALLPIRLESKNISRRRHWAANHKKKQEFINAFWALGLTPRAPAPNCKQHLTITRVLGKREKLWDTSNGLGGSCSELIDSMKYCGFFVDDSDKYLTVEFKQDDTRRHEGPATEILLEAKR